MASAVKQIAQITGAETLTVSNWYQGKNVPSSRHLLDLARVSPSILRFVLSQIGGELLVEAYDIFTDRANHPTHHPHTVKASVISNENVSDNVSINPAFSMSINRRQQWFLVQLRAGANVTAKDIATNWDVDVRTAWRDIDSLIKSKHVRFTGSRRLGHYHTVNF